MDSSTLGRSFEAVTAERMPGRRRAQLLGGFALGVAGVLAAGRMLRAHASDPRREQPLDEVNEASDDSFPASDPPSFTPGHAGRPDHRQDAGGEDGGADPADRGTD